MGKNRQTTDWGTTTLQDLRRLAQPHSDMTSSFEWLKKVGLIPDNVTRMDVRQVLTDLDPDNISVKYIAAAAFEWDQWGPASPDDFVKAIACETRGANRDLVMETLMALGGSKKAEPVGA